MTVVTWIFIQPFTGIYSPPQAARYLNAADSARKAYPSVNSSKLTRWIRQGLASSDFAGVHGADLTLTFPDLVSMRVIAALRNAGVGWREIRNSELWLRETTGSRCPFASESIWTGQGQVYVDWESRLISAGRNGQIAFDILRRHLIPAHGLTFSKESGMAESWTPAKGVSLHPEIQFGAPCIENTRIPTAAIYGMVKGGDSPQFTARSYRISSESMEAAIDWERRLEAA